MFIRFGFTDLKAVFRDSGIVIQYSAVAFLIPIIFTIYYQEAYITTFIYFLCAAITFLIGVVLKHLFKTNYSSGLVHAFFTATIVWVLFSFLAGLPFYFISGVPLHHAFFESVSALTTTGLSVVLPWFDSYPNSLIFWRSFIAWAGGIGIVVMALMGVTGSYSKASNLITAEGRNQQIRPNPKNSVKEIWSIYVGLTLIGILFLYLSGMPLWESLNYSMSAISTTGMGTDSIGLTGESAGWDPVGLRNNWTTISLIFIMIMGATSFFVHFLFFKRGQFKILFKDSEFKFLILMGLLSSLIIFPKFLVFFGGMSSMAIESSLYYTFSSLTCGGPALHSSLIISSFESFSLLLLIILMIIGGSSGSTAGGIKISRFLIFLKGIYWKIKSSVLPKKSFFTKKFDGRVLSDEDISEVYQFILLWSCFLIIGTLIVSWHGYPFDLALFEVASAQSNAGVSVGITSSTMPISVEIMLIINMLIGRLEILPIFAVIGFFAGISKKKQKMRL